MPRKSYRQKPRNRILERPLPGIVPQCCPMCDQPATVLGQFDPTSDRYWICADCGRKYRYPVEMLRVTNDGTWSMPEYTRAQLNHRQDVTDAVYKAVVGRRQRSKIAYYKYLMTGLFSFINELPEHLQMVFERQLTRTHQWVVVARATRELSNTVQLQLPLCNRCGCSHDRRFQLGYTNFKPYCQQCDDELAVEALFRHKGIFGNDDDETIIDRIYRSHKETFERGVMPTYWSTLKQKAGAA
jgi:transcription elongation factor Elf1